MIYNTRNWSNDTTESQKEKKTCFNAHFQYSQSKIMALTQHIHLNTVCVNMKKSFNQNFLNSLTLHKNHIFMKQGEKSKCLLHIMTM